MAVSIGKRKRQEDEDDKKGDSGDEDAMRALFQRAFEAKFKPLERTVVTFPEPQNEAEFDEADNSDGTDSDWSGLSGDQDPLETIQYSVSHADNLDVQRNERRAFMSSRPPISAKNSTSTSKFEEEAQEDDASELANKKHDLALQRLLKESHLLNPASFKTTASHSHGKGRLKALDLRMNDLGAKDASLPQQKMPLAHRRGINAKATDREERRRQDALENGVVLEREKRKSNSKQAKFREKGIGGPAIGRFKGGTLKIRQRDVRSLQDEQRKKRR